MTGKKPTRIERVQQYADGTRSASQIARLTGMTQAHVHTVAHEARQRGIEINLRPVGTIKGECDRSETPWHLVAPLADGTRSAKEIAALLGCEPRRVTNAVAYARRAYGMNVSVQTKRSQSTRKRRQADAVTGGGIRQLVAALTPEARSWLLDTVPPGATLSEAIVAIITDAYFEERSVN